MTGLKQTTDGEEYATEYPYNLSGALIEETYPSGRKVKNILDTNGDLAQVQSRTASDTFKNYVNSFTYTAAGAVSSLRLGNGRWENTTFNSRLQPTQIGLGSGATSQNLLKLDYTYNTSGNDDNNGNVLSQTITVPTVGSSPGFTAEQDYTYDSLNRINDAVEKITPVGGSSSQSWKQAFTYDRYGNRNFDEANTTTLTKACGSSPSFTVCAADRKVENPEILVSNNRIKSDQDGDSVNDYVFDSSGNTTKDVQSRKFTYDAENKQVKVETVDGSGNPIAIIGEYIYDGDGKRIKKVVPNTGETTIFVYSAGGQLVAEYSTIVASPQDAKIAYLTADNLGSPRVNTDQYGAVIARHDYHPFGEEIFSSGRTTALGYTADTIRKQFTGYERDNETGLDFAQARYYAKNLGRFNSADEPLIDQFEDNPQSWNLYIYVRNNPLNLVDPLGGQADCPPGSVEGCYERDGKYYVKNEDGSEGELDDPYPVKIDSSIEGDSSSSTSLFARGPRRGPGRRSNIFDRFFRDVLPGWFRHFRNRISPPRQSPPSTSRPNEVYGPPSPPPQPKIHMGRQGKHIVGHNNYTFGKSILTANPQHLANSAGTGQQVGRIPIGQTGSRERVDFGYVIGYHVTPTGTRPTTKGIIHYSSSGIHIVPAQP